MQRAHACFQTQYTCFDLFLILLQSHYSLAHLASHSSFATCFTTKFHAQTTYPTKPPVRSSP